MKITHVAANTRKKAFEVRTDRDHYEFPFAKLRLQPAKDNRITEVFVDPELGEEAFTYRLQSGEEDTVPVDAVLEVAKDPEYLQDILLHRLTVEARKGLEESSLSKRQVARQLGTSPSQLYRLLDPANRRHAIGQILALLDLVGKEVHLVVRPRMTLNEKPVEVVRESAGASETGRVGKRGTFVIPAKLRRRFDLSEGSTVIAEETEEGILLRPADTVPVESYSAERRAEFLLSNAVDDEDHARARAAVREMGVAPVRTRRPGSHPIPAVTPAPETAARYSITPMISVIR